MATVRLAKSGLWQAIVRRKGYPAQSKTFDRKAEAELWAATLESEMGRGIFQSSNDAERTTFADLAERFKTEFAPYHYKVRDDNKEAWRFQVDRLAEFFGSYSLAAIDQRLVAAFRDVRLKGGSRAAVGESTVRKEIFMLSKVLYFAQTECGIQLPRGNPVDKVRKPAESKGRERRLSAEEMTALENEVRKSRNPWLWLAYRLALATAMRQGELLALTWSDVDLPRRLAILRETKNGEQRAVPLTTAALEVLRSMPHALDGRVVPLDRMTLFHAFRASARRAGIADYTWHDLRHEALSRLAERGDLSVLELAAVSGHKTLQMLKRYTHLQAENLALKLG